jgi:hypothetical protein
VYWSRPGDPTYRLHATDRARHGIEGKRIPIPAGARPAGAADAHMTIVTPDGWEYDLWGAQTPPPRGGTLTFRSGGRIRIDGSGLDSAATASHFGNLAGVIRPEELSAGHIDHALVIVVRNTSRSYVYPAAASDGYRYGGVPMGSRFQLAMSDAQIAALSAPRWKKTILTALARYGGYVGDSGGSGFGFEFLSGQTYTSFGRSDPLVDYARAVGIHDKGGRYVFDVPSGVDWARYLRVLAPPKRARD